MDDFVQIGMDSQEFAVALIQTDPIAVLILSVHYCSQTCAERITDLQGGEVFCEIYIGLEDGTTIDAG